MTASQTLPLRIALATASAASLLAARFFPLASDLPMVGEVWLGKSSEGSGLSWAGDVRVVVGCGLLAAAVLAAALRRDGLFRTMAGISLGWALAFAYNGFSWYREQMELLSMMQAGDTAIQIKLAPASLLFSLYVMLSLGLSFLGATGRLTWESENKERGHSIAE